MYKTDTSIKIGDFVTSYSAGYWQLIDIKPKIADDDILFQGLKCRKGDVISKWAILKKAFTPKMKPRIDFSYEDFSWLCPVSEDVLTEIQRCFTENPEYKIKFDNAEIKLRPTVTNLWINLPEEEEERFSTLLRNLSPRFEMDEFMENADRYKCYITNPPTSYVLNLLSYPWELDEEFNKIYHGYELKRI